MTFKLVIFDCDGVLVESETLGNNVFAGMLNTYGHQISGEESASRFRGMKLATCLEILEHESGIVLPKSFETDLRRQMSAVFRKHLKPVKGARRLVESMRVPFCVASSGPRKKIEENLRTTGLHPHFVNRSFSGYEVQSWKPDPGLFLAAASHFGVAPKDCVVIEDSFVGVSAGIAANMAVIGLGGSNDDESVAAAHKTFTSLDDIQTFFVSQGIARKN